MAILIANGRMITTSLQKARKLLENAENPAATPAVAPVVAPAHTYTGYRSEIGKIILSRDGAEKGVITNIVRRWCAGCQGEREVFSVKWKDGSRTYPCPSGCSVLEDGTYKIN